MSLLTNQIGSRPLTAESFKAAMGSVAAGVTVVTGIDPKGTPCGMTVTAFCSVSLEPPMCLLCLGHRGRTLQVIRESERFAVNMLGSEQRQLSAHFASHEPNK